MMSLIGFLAMTNKERSEFAHEPALVSEVIEWLALPEGGTLIDFTVGGGGHLEQLVRSSSAAAEFFGVDRDADAVSAAGARLREFPQVKRIVHAPFGSVSEILSELQLKQVDRALFDLGVSSHQIDTPARGFSFQADGPLDMRMDRESGSPASELINSASEDELTRIIYTYGEERRARKIARAICASRDKKPLETVGELHDVIEGAVGRPNLTKTLARVYQAFRIAVNDELGELERALPQVVSALAPGGRVGVISYHSLEDRIVKDFFRSKVGECVCPPELPVCACGARAQLKILTRKPVTAAAEELESNPRSRSAKLRVAEKISASTTLESAR